MHYVYIIRSINNPDQNYVGNTSNLKTRLAQHNSGNTFHTEKYKPWELVLYLGFRDKMKAISFEKYLKSGSGRIFKEKRFL